MFGRSALIASALISAAAVIALPAATADAVGTCGGKPATMTFGAGDDDIRGTSGNDVIVAGGGDDTVNGLGGNDSVCGRAGLDVLFGGDGNDDLFGNWKSDDLYGANGNDDLFGNRHDDRLNGGLGVDTCDGGAGTGDAAAAGTCESTQRTELIGNPPWPFCPPHRPCSAAHQRRG
jgi:RTX calcium-binding nonapeptide repeat (4 copies)